MIQTIGISFLTLAIELTILFFGITFLINILQGFIPYERLEQYLFIKRPLVGGLIALLLAFITPFCSCSTIPLVVNMLNKKIRFGVVMVFLFSSPILDPTILTIMIAMLGWEVAFMYTMITSILSLIIGFTLEAFRCERYIKNIILTSYVEKTKRFDITLAWKETITLMKTVFPYLLLGAFIGSIISGAIPTEWFARYFGGDNWWLVPIAAIVGIPLYIRLSTMIPISQILIAKGMALGPIMAMMISSAGASIPEITLLHSIFKKQLIVIFIVSVFTMASLSGLLFYIL